MSAVTNTNESHEEVEPPRSGSLRTIVGIDGSDPAATALELVDGIDWPPASEFHIIEAIEDTVPATAGPWPTYGHVDSPDLTGALHEQATRTVASSVARLERSSRTVTSEVAYGNASRAVISGAAAFEADLVVVGSHGRGPVASRLFGSVSAELAVNSPAPVLIARNPGIERVLLAWDGTSAAERAAELLLGWSIFDESIVRVTSVAPAGHDWAMGVHRRPASPDRHVDVETGNRVDSRLVDGMAERLRSTGRPTRPDLRYGDPGREIVAAASAWRADLIVMGTHGRRGLEYLLLGSVARHVIDAAPCSVLIARS